MEWMIGLKEAPLWIVAPGNGLRVAAAMPCRLTWLEYPACRRDNRLSGA